MTAAELSHGLPDVRCPLLPFADFCLRPEADINDASEP